MREPTVGRTFGSDQIPFSLAPSWMLHRVAGGTWVFEAEGEFDDPDVSQRYAKILLAERAGT